MTTYISARCEIFVCYSLPLGHSHIKGKFLYLDDLVSYVSALGSVKLYSSSRQLNRPEGPNSHP